jgi:O-acetyl-ADP-ribose deacetylase (regulator of RNase III)
MREVDGNLVTMALEGHFDMIVHGANCFCTMGAGIAKEIKERIPDAWYADERTIRGDIMKLGCYSQADVEINYKGWLKVINAYTQYRYGRNHKDGDERPVDYDAIKLVMRKINHNFKGKSIGIPLIGAGLAGGDWNTIKGIITEELKDMDVTIVHYKK